MGLGQLVRRWGLAVALAATSLLSWQAAERRDTDDVSQQRLHYDQSLSTAMLSARRVPRTIQAPVIDDRIRPSLERIVSGSPPDSCLMVRVGDRILTPAANVKLPLIPASNQKVLTTYVAMVLLGSDFRYRTTVRSDVEVVSGVINGNLYLIGDGDPFLSTDNWWSQYEVVDGRFHTRLEDLADEIVAAGVTAVTGQLIGDESLFDSDRIGPWAERLIAGKQSGPLSALTVNEGFVSWPEVYAASARSRSETENPPLHAASVLFQLLLERGITIGGVGADTAPPTTTLVAAIESPPLVEIVTHINSYSSNIGAELLLKRIGHSGRAAGTTADGAEVVLEE